MSPTTLTWYGPNGLLQAKIHYASIFGPKLLIILCPIIRHGVGRSENLRGQVVLNSMPFMEKTLLLFWPKSVPLCPNLSPLPLLP